MSTHKTIPPPPPHKASVKSGPSAPASLEVLIRARYPLLYVVTWEEERALAELHKVAQQLGKKVYDWSIVQGLARYRASLDAPVEGKKGTKDPIIALREVLNSGEASIFVFRDFHNFVQDSSVKRTLRDLASMLRSSLSTVVLLSPILRIPEELEKDISIFDYPLPGRPELDKLLRQIAADIADNPGLSIDLSDESREAILDASIGLTLNEAENVFAKTLVTAQRLSAKEAPLVYAEKQQVIRKSGLLEYIDVGDSLASVGGLDQLKSWLSKRRVALDPRSRVQVRDKAQDILNYVSGDDHFGLPPPRGLLLVGVQGCGKSLAAKATATELNYPLVRMDVGRLYSKLVGETESNVRRALQIAEAVAPVVLWVDELEKGLSGVGSSDSSDGGTSSRLLGTILTWLQEKTSPVFVVATANDIEKLPPEVLRKGRFDEIFFVDLPAEAERREIFAIHLAKRRRNPEKFNLDYLAAESDGYSGAEIEQLIVESMFNVYGIKPDIETADLIYSLKAQVPLSRTMSKSIMERRIWAKGRTISASSVHSPDQDLDKHDAGDDQKERLLLDYLSLCQHYPCDAVTAAEHYLGSFPRKTDDGEKMRIYVADFERLCRLIAGRIQQDTARSGNETSQS